MSHKISNDTLTLWKIKEIIDHNETITLSEESEKQVLKCREYLDSKMEDIGRPVYGVTTGFGSLCNITIPEEDLSQLQHNLVMSHACGTGDTVRPEIVKLMLLLKVQSLSYGHSGVQLATIGRLMDMFNNDILPVVYQQGSLGASGDLAPLAHLCLPIIGMGEVLYHGEVRSAADVWQELGWEPIRLQSKEGLALLNGTQFMSAHAVWALLKSQRLSRWADCIGAMSLEAFDGRIEPFYELTHLLRRHKGQMETADAFLSLLEGSELIRRPKQHVQDPYSFRCIPQVHGAVKDNIRYVESVIGNEINSATDNPNVFPDEDMIISAGNFHGEPIAIPMDTLAIAMSEACKYLRETYLQTYQRSERPADVPGRKTWSEQRIHDSSVHGRIYREPEQDALLACFMRFHPFFPGTGGPREHGFELCHETGPRDGQCGDRSRHRAVQCSAGA